VDGCTIVVTVRREDAPKFEPFFFGSLHDSYRPAAEVDDAVTLGVDDGRFGVDELETLGVPFVGYHGDGDDFSPAVFAFDGTTYAYCLASATGAEPVVPYGNDGTPVQAELENLQKYLRVRASALKKLAAGRMAEEYPVPHNPWVA